MTKHLDMVGFPILPRTHSSAAEALNTGSAWKISGSGSECTDTVLNRVGLLLPHEINELSIQNCVIHPLQHALALRKFWDSLFCTFALQDLASVAQWRRALCAWVFWQRWKAVSTLK